MTDQHIPPPAQLLDGSEPFVGLKANVAEFWAYMVRDLRTNTTRGLLAEWMVSKAVGAEGAQPEWAAYDVLSGDGKTRIEVKTSAYLQSWAQTRHSSIRFGNLKTRKWDPLTGEESEPTFGADVYVFCVQTARDHESYNPLDVGQWDFYVLPRAVLVQIDQRSIGLFGIEARTSAIKFDDLAEAINSAASGDRPSRGDT